MKFTPFENGIKAMTSYQQTMTLVSFSGIDDPEAGFQAYRA